MIDADYADDLALLANTPTQTDSLLYNLKQYLIMLSVKQGGIKYHFLSLWYDSTWD